MQDHLDQHRRENHINQRGRRFSARLIRTGAIVAVAVCTLTCVAAAQDNGAIAGFDGGPMDSGAVPMSNSGGGSFFSQDLGTILRLRYNTESYGQDDQGNLDIGTMQVLNFDDSIAFFDGQLTLNDTNGAGFNLGLGYRWLSMVPYSAEDPMVVNGLSIWADGTSTEANNFFPQVGVSYESLGDLWDLRSNAYVPLGPQEQTGNFTPTGEIGFDENFIAELTRATVDSSFYAADAEIARRLGAERDAWAFAGPYFLANDNDDTLGYRAGFRGYAYPDLLLQIAVSHDDIFATNAAFSVTWFVGRTRTNFQPACGVPDRMREPVMRNDYVALSKRTTFGGNPLTGADGEPIRVVHVDSNAAAGGDGTFERPLNTLGNINANSQDGDIVYVHSQSEFQGGAGAVLKDNQRFLGEGNDFNHTVVTQEDGTISIPESSPGAKALPRPMILAALGDAVNLADTNEVSNFDIDGQGITARAIVSGPAGAGNPGLRELSIKNTTGDGIVTTPFVRVDEDNPNLKTVAGSVTINNVTFDNIGGNDIDIDAATTEDVNNSNITLQETLSITNVTSTNGNGVGIAIANTHTAATGRSTTISNYTYDGGTTSQGGVQLQNFDGSFTMSTSSLTNGDTTGIGFQILGESDGTFNIADSVTMDSIDGTSFDIDGRNGTNDEFTGTVTMNADIASDSGRSVSLQGISGTGTNVTFTGDIIETAGSQGLLINRNSGGIIIFSGDVTQSLTAVDAITLTNNTGADINFGGTLDITTTATNKGFIATGGGTLTASNTNNKIRTETGRIVQITDMTISTAGVNFPKIDRTTAGATDSAVLLQNNTGGPILLGTVGDDAGESGVIAGGSTDAIVVNNSANVTVSGLRINNTNAVSGVVVDKSTSTAMTVNLNDLEINDGDIGVEVKGNATSANLTMTINDNKVIGASAVGMSFDDVDNGTVQVNNALVDGDGAAATAGMRIQNSNASFTFDSATRIQEVSGADFLVDGGAGTVNMAGDITNTAGTAVTIQNVTGGTVTLSATSSINDTNGQGVLINNNTGGTFTLLGDNNLNTGANTAVTVTNNTGATTSLSDLNIDTTTGNGLVATGGGTLTVLGTTNTIDTVDGVGLRLEDVTIGASGVALQSVNVTSGNTNGIILQNLTSGQISVGITSGAADSGGTLTTTNEAIIVRNVQNVDLNKIRVANAGANNVLIEHTSAATTAMDVTIDGLNLDATAGTGLNVLGANNGNVFNLRLRNSDLENNVAMSVTGSGAFGLLVENNSIDTGAGTDVAFALGFTGSAQTGNVTFRNRNVYTADNASALSITTSGATAKTINVLVDGTGAPGQSQFINNSLNAAADFLSSGSTTMNATIQGSIFDDANAGGSDFTMTASGAQGRMRLNLGGDTAADFNSANGVGTYNLIETGGADFDVFEKTDTFANARNNGTVAPQSPAGVANPGAFDDLLVAPPLPTVP